MKQSGSLDNMLIMTAKDAFSYLLDYFKGLELDSGCEYFFVISHNCENSYWVSFYVDGEDIVCEAVSNKLLSKSLQLSNNKLTLLNGLGWELTELGIYACRINSLLGEKTLGRVIRLLDDTIRNVFCLSETELWKVEDSSQPTNFKQPEPLIKNPTAPIKIPDGWCITPDEKFNLTLNCNESTAIRFQSLLYQGNNRSLLSEGRSGPTSELIKFMVLHQIECIEVKKYFDENINFYLARMETLRGQYQKEIKNISISARDEYKLHLKAIDELDIDSSIRLLFCGFLTSNDWVYRGDLLNRYDSPVIEFYLNWYDKKFEKVLFVEPGDKHYAMAHLAIQAGLAKNGRDISIEELVNAIRIDNINAVLGTTYRRRSEIIKELQARPNPYELLEVVADLKNFVKYYVYIEECDINSFNKAFQWAYTTANVLHKAICHSYIYARAKWYFTR